MLRSHQFFSFLPCYIYLLFMTPLSYGILGAGSVARQHALAIQQSPSCRLAAVGSTDLSRATAFAAPYGAKAYGDYQALIQDAEVEAVVICTASGDHLPWAILAAAAGKHVLIEKPIEVTLERAQQILKACKQNQVVLGGIFQHRFGDHFQYLKSVIQSGQMGRLLLGNAYIKWYRSPDYYKARPWRGTKALDGGAALINQGIHTVDLLQDLMGNAVQVSAQTRTLSHAIEGEDLATAIVEFENGAIGTIEASTAIYPDGFPERLEIHGEKGSAVLSGGRIVHWSVAGVAPPPENEPATTSGSSDPTAIGFVLHQRQLEDFAQSVRNHTPTGVDGPSASRALSIIDAVYRSAAGGRKAKVKYLRF